MSNTSADLPPGAFYLPSFISPEEEAGFVGHLDAGDWNAELRRRVQHFGYRYDYKARTVTSDAYPGPLPEWLQDMSERLVAMRLFDGAPDQVIANEYLPGQGISAHIDCVPCFDDTIVSLSLLSRCEMVFREKPSGARLAVMLEPCSALVMTGAARYQWTHEIPARKSDLVDGTKVDRSRRISLTFRKIVRTI
ncbi:alpha-ketoglutarate-dependent dioxygenase AlkB [uncultured Hoeflea sp.]|uniref:alpha-ketoglutarate-dependent dioxygenase AlkB n=1 Tax=uncultured Hoeflea sp. TaxID=538666 RepID=UPI0026239396|nr:alpha-ketoglutarate-dependent dioxygenase AlkB [uncultured Hoeflea sp.]